MMHPFIVGEVALGNLRRRENVLGAMCELPQTNVAADSEVPILFTRRLCSAEGSATSMPTYWRHSD
jgi:hypothetical protein